METVRRLLPVLVALALSGSTAAAADQPTFLQITVWPEGRQVAQVHRFTLACSPARGTVPHPATACTLLDRRGARAFAPTPPTTACTDLWGGPAKAWVRGVVRGRGVDARFSMSNGCEIARWNRVRSVVPR
jgi:subtilisin inhibitor-like